MQYLLKDRLVIPEPDYLSWILWKSETDPVVKQTQFEFDVFISTVFTGSPGFTIRSEPLVFETMIFWDGCTERYKWATLDQAEFEHQALEKRIQGILDIPFGSLALMLSDTDPLVSYIVRKRLSALSG